MATYTISFKNEAGETRQQSLYLFQQAPGPAGGMPQAWFSAPRAAEGRAGPFNYAIDYGAQIGQPNSAGLPAPGVSLAWPAPAYRVAAALTPQAEPDGGPGTAGDDAASQAANPSHV